MSVSSMQDNVGQPSVMCDLCEDIFSECALSDRELLHSFIVSSCAHVARELVGGLFQVTSQER
jgi:hypothetical protein